MTPTDPRIRRLLSHLHKATALLGRRPLEEIDRQTFEEAEDVIEKALNICHREIGDEDLVK